MDDARRLALLRVGRLLSQIDHAVAASDFAHARELMAEVETWLKEAETSALNRGPLLRQVK